MASRFLSHPEMFPSEFFSGLPGACLSRTMWSFHLKKKSAETWTEVRRLCFKTSSCAGTPGRSGKEAGGTWATWPDHALSHPKACFVTSTHLLAMSLRLPWRNALLAGPTYWCQKKPFLQVSKLWFAFVQFTAAWGPADLHEHKQQLCHYALGDNADKAPSAAVTSGYNMTKSPNQTRP